MSIYLVIYLKKTHAIYFKCLLLLFKMVKKYSFVIKVLKFVTWIYLTRVLFQIQLVTRQKTHFLVNAATMWNETGLQQLQFTCTSLIYQFFIFTTNTLSFSYDTALNSFYTSPLVTEVGQSTSPPRTFVSNRFSFVT